MSSKPQKRLLITLSLEGVEFESWSGRSVFSFSSNQICEFARLNFFTSPSPPPIRDTIPHNHQKQASERLLTFMI